MTGEAYRVVRSTFFTPPQLALAPTYSRVEDAVASMGDGVVVTRDGVRLVAFHERHLKFLTDQPKETE